MNAGNRPPARRHLRPVRDGELGVKYPTPSRLVPVLACVRGSRVTPLSWTGEGQSWQAPSPGRGVPSDVSASGHLLTGKGRIVLSIRFPPGCRVLEWGPGGRTICARDWATRAGQAGMYRYRAKSQQLGDSDRGAGSEPGPSWSACQGKSVGLAGEGLHERCETCNLWPTANGASCLPSLRDGPMTEEAANESGPM